MGVKNKKNKKEGGEKEDGGGGKNVKVVLKTDLHCEGCASKIVKCIRSFDDVETVSVDESAKITVVGKVDPVQLREKLEQKTNKKVELISPQPKKDNKSNGNEDEKENAKEKSNENNNKKQDKQKECKDKNAKEKSKSDEKKQKPKLPPVTTAVFKVYFHCQGCIQKIHKLVSKTKGYEDMKIDRQKDLVTVTGAIEMKELAELLKKHLKRDVEIVPPKKEEKKENGGGVGGEKGKGGGGSGGKEKGSGGGGKEKGGNGGGGAGGGGEQMEGNRMQFQVGYPYPHPFVYEPGSFGDPQFHYNPIGPYNAPQMFSDENPNACTVM